MEVLVIYTFAFCIRPATHREVVVQTPNVMQNVYLLTHNLLLCHYLDMDSYFRSNNHAREKIIFLGKVESANHLLILLLDLTIPMNEVARGQKNCFSGWPLRNSKIRSQPRKDVLRSRKCFLKLT